MDNSKGNILIAEEDIALRSLLTHLLQSQGYVVTRAGNGQEALQELNRGDFDLLITDAALPLLNGQELTARARPGLPVLIISANREIIRDRSKTHASVPVHFGYLVKPFRPSELLRQVARLIDRQSNQALAMGGGG